MGEIGGVRGGFAYSYVSERDKQKFMIDALDAEIVVAITALVAVVVGPLISIYIVRKQIKAQVASSNRQAWIDGFRSKVASFVSKTTSLSWDFNRDGRLSGDARQKIDDVGLLLMEVKLYTNPNEADHVRLINRVSEFANDTFGVLEGEPSSGENYGIDIISITQNILRKEWERVKKGG